MGKTSNQFADRQAHMLVNAASKVHTWANRYGDQEQQDLALAMLTYVRDTLEQMGLYARDITPESDDQC